MILSARARSPSCLHTHTYLTPSSANNPRDLASTARKRLSAIARTYLVSNCTIDVALSLASCLPKPRCAPCLDSHTNPRACALIQIKCYGSVTVSLVTVTEAFRSSGGRLLGVPSPFFVFILFATHSFLRGHRYRPENKQPVTMYLLLGESLPCVPEA